MKVKKVLVVDDNIDIQETFFQVLEYFIKGVEILRAYTVREAKEFFMENSDINLIVMDAQLSTEGIAETVEIIKKFRKTFKGPMIAASTSLELNKRLVKAGCDYQTPKDDIIDTLKKILS